MRIAGKPFPKEQLKLLLALSCLWIVLYVVCASVTTYAPLNGVYFNVDGQVQSPTLTVFDTTAMCDRRPEPQLRGRIFSSFVRPRYVHVRL